MSYEQDVSKPVSQILTQVGIGVAVNPHDPLSLLFRNPKDATILNKNVIWYIKFLAGIAMLCMYLKQDAVLKPENRNMLMRVKTFNTKKSALSQHSINFNYIFYD